MEGNQIAKGEIMALQCGQCPQTFRTQNGKEWHALHIHGDSSTDETSGQDADNALEAMIENEISAQISDPDSPLNVVLDARGIGFRKEVAQMIADSDQFTRTHIEHRVEEIVLAMIALHREPTWKGQRVEMAQPANPRPDPATHRHSSRGGQVVEMAQPATSFSPEVIANALEWGLQFRTGISLEIGKNTVRELRSKSTVANHKGVNDFLASLEGS